MLMGVEMKAEHVLHLCDKKKKGRRAGSRKIMEKGKSGRLERLVGGGSESRRESCWPQSASQMVGMNWRPGMKNKPLTRFHLFILVNFLHCDMPCKHLQLPMKSSVCLISSSWMWC